MSVTDIQTLTKQNQDLQHKVANLEQGISNAQKSLHRIENDSKKSSHRIEQGLFGDEDISHRGAISDIKELRCLYIDVAARVESMRLSKLNEDTLLKNNKTWLFGISSAIGGVIVWIFNYLTKYL